MDINPKNETAFQCRHVTNVIKNSRTIGARVWECLLDKKERLWRHEEI